MDTAATILQSVLIRQSMNTIFLYVLCDWRFEEVNMCSTEEHTLKIF